MEERYLSSCCGCGLPNCELWFAKMRPPWQLVKVSKKRGQKAGRKTTPTAPVSVPGAD